MKFLVLILLSLSSLQAATISHYIEKPEGTSIQSYELNNGEAVFKKKSNFFDTNRDLTLGEFVPTDNRGINIQEERIQKILNQIKEVDKFLSSKNQSFNDLSPKSFHETAIVINNYRITKSSILYPEAEAVLESLKKRQWRQIAGVKVSADLKKLNFIEGGKQVKTEDFNFPFHCSSPTPPATCRYKDLGPLYIQ